MLEKLKNMPEQQNIEYKTSWRDEYLKWICGFANANRGKVFRKMRNNNLKGKQDDSKR